MPRAPRKITAPYLQRVTAHYLGRYSTTRANLRRVLMRRVHRSAAHHDADPADGAVLVEDVLDHVEALGLVNDGQYATDRARALNRRGSGSRKIRATLAAKGVHPDLIAQALDALAEDGRDPEFEAACTFARKRRLGPWRRAPADRDARRKELAKMGRAGFSFDLARRVVELSEPPD